MKHTLIITTAATIRMSKSLVDALEPRDIKYYFSAEFKPDLVILRRENTPTWITLNGRTQYIATRMLAHRMMEYGFKTGIHYEVAMSGDSCVLACRNVEPDTSPVEDTVTVSNEERRQRQEHLLEMIYGKGG